MDEFIFKVKVKAATEMEALTLMLDLKGVADDLGHEIVWYQQS